MFGVVTCESLTNCHKGKILSGVESVKPGWKVRAERGLMGDRNEAFAQRMATALVWAGNVAGRQVTQREILDAMSPYLKLKKPLSEGALSKYLSGRVPKVEIIGAIAKATSTDPGWLAFGPDSKAEGPPIAAAQLAKKATKPGKRERA